MAAKVFVEAVVDERVCRKLREKHPRTINDAVKQAQMVEADQLWEEQWQEYDKEDIDIDKFQEKSKTVEECVSQLRVEAPSKAQVGVKAGKKFKPWSSVTCIFARWLGIYRTTHLR